MSVTPLEEPEAHRCNNAKISLASLSSSLELGEERTDRMRAWVFCAKGRNVTGCDWRISRSASSMLARISASDKEDGGPESAQKFKRLPIVVGRFGTTISRMRVGLSVVRAVNMRVRVAATSLCVAGGSGLCVYHRISINIRSRIIGKKNQESFLTANNGTRSRTQLPPWLARHSKLLSTDAFTSATPLHRACGVLLWSSEETLVLYLCSKTPTSSPAPADFRFCALVPLALAIELQDSRTEEE